MKDSPHKLTGKLAELRAMREAQFLAQSKAKSKVRPMPQQARTIKRRSLKKGR